MADEQTPRSGSRWEPDTGPEGSSTPAAEPVSGTHDTVRQPVQQDADPAPAATESDEDGPAGLPPYAGVTSHPYGPPPRRRWRNRLGRRGLAVAGGAAALVLVSGLGGFAIGHAVGEHGHFGPGDARFREVGFHERGPLPPGYGQGLPPQFGGEDRDGDGYGPGLPGQGTLPNQGTSPGQGGSPGANPNQQSGMNT